MTVPRDGDKKMTSSVEAEQNSSDTGEGAGPASEKDAGTAREKMTGPAKEKNSGSDPKKAADSVGPSTRRTREENRRSPLVLGLIIAVVIAALVAAVAGWRAMDYRDQLAQERATAADAAKAKQVASDYAVAAAQINFRNFDPWFTSLTSGVSDELAKQFKTSEPALRDLLGQLQWVSSGSLIGADVKSHTGNTYVVNVFVDVSTSNVQSPEGVKTTALYPISLDSGQGWKVTDISGGIAPLQPGK